MSKRENALSVIDSRLDKAEKNSESKYIGV